MTRQEELREIVGHMKRSLVVHRDMGMDPPPLSPSILHYLKGGGPSSDFSPDSIEALQAYIGECRRCKLCLGRTRLVFGEGSSEAGLMFVGEAPGREEDLEGRPFVGEAGRLLTRMIQAMGLVRETVYICNVVKCRPPHNRDPEVDEIMSCLPFLKKQIQLLRPKVICTLGRIAAQSLLERDVKITRERGKWFTYMGIPVMPTYHPAYLIRNPAEKRPVWEDIQKIMKHMGMEVKRDA